MKLLYTNENRLIFGNVRNIVEASGIRVMVKNEFAVGGVGELSPFDAWPELWVETELDYQRGTELIRQTLNGSEAPDWTCAHCAERNAGAFEFCWHCGREGPSRSS